MSQTIIIYLV